MTQGVPVVRITIAAVVLVGMFLIAGVALFALGQPTAANGALGTATGIAIGAGGATGITIYTNKNGAAPPPAVEPPKAA